MDASEFLMDILGLIFYRFLSEKSGTRICKMPCQVKTSRIKKHGQTKKIP
ncbi:hypothetical protein ACVNPZ_00670 [Staphylococcus aureus]